MFLPIAAIALFAIAQASVSVHNPNYCLTSDPIQPQNSMFSIYTSYENIRGNNIDTTLSACTPRKFWYFGRGGSRLSTAAEISRMSELSTSLRENVVNNFENGFDSLCRRDFDMINAWRFNSSVTPDRDSEIVDAGRDELREIARRFQTAYPTLLPRTYNRSDFTFRHTYRARTEESLFAFADGLFGHQDIVLEDVPAIDRLLRPIDDCPLFQAVSPNRVEQAAFENGPEYRQMMVEVNRKLGFLETNQLSSEDIRTMWNICRMELNWTPSNLSPWCAAFSIANQAVLEYFEDLGFYFSNGYGGDERLFSNLNCHIMQELLQFLQSNNPNDPIARLFISHSTIMQLFLVNLGVFRDESHLTRHNFAQMTFRQWATSRVSSKATNFVVVQHECAAGAEPELAIYYNERPLHIPGCEGNGFCRQSTFMRIFQRFLNANCMQLFCSRN